MDISRHTAPITKRSGAQGNLVIVSGDFMCGTIETGRMKVRGVILWENGG